MSKEEILRKHNLGQNNTWLKSTVDKMEEAMDEWAAQESVKFHYFVTSQKFGYNNLRKRWEHTESKEVLSEHEMWSEYLKYREYLNTKGE